jgi:hypothetical protein
MLGSATIGAVQPYGQEQCTSEHGAPAQHGDQRRSKPKYLQLRISQERSDALHGDGGPHGDGHPKEKQLGRVREVHLWPVHVMPDADHHSPCGPYDEAGGKRGAEQPARLVFGELEEGEDYAREERQQGRREKTPCRNVASAYFTQGEVDAAPGRTNQQQMDQGQIMNHTMSLHCNLFS